MKKQKSKDVLHVHRLDAINDLNAYISALIDSTNESNNHKADKLCYWLTDWTTFLEFESKFSPLSLRRYKRGEIVKVHLGFNVGSEEGGLHYAVVVDKYNAKSSPVVTVVPLTSVKSTTDITNLKPGCVFLGNELFTNLSQKVSTTTKHLNGEIEALLSTIKNNTDISNIEDLQHRLHQTQQETLFLQRMRNETDKMKKGSIALVNQITTISKIRIYDPKTDHDILSNIKLSNEKLDLLDKEIVKMYTNS